MKECIRCRHIKSLELFADDVRWVDGKKHYCLECEGKKQCEQCYQVLSVQEFGSDRSRPGGLTRYCKPCQKEKSARAYYKDVERSRENQRLGWHKRSLRPGVKEHRRTRANEWARKNPVNIKNNALKARRGITLKEFYAMFKAQNGLCKMCGLPPKAGKEFDVDHCHHTGKIRGLLHRRCNSKIGIFKDDPEQILQALFYLTGNIYVPKNSPDNKEIT